MSFFNSVRNLVYSQTELKVRQATDENEIIRSTGTLMNEISVLTYSAKTLKEIIGILKKKLSLLYGLKNGNGIISHKVCVQVLKTFTLISYLLNNGSNDFINWLKLNNGVLQILAKVDSNNHITDDEDLHILNQAQKITKDIILLINDNKLLEKRRKDVIQFRSSISSPGRKSTDNSHLRLSNELKRSSEEIMRSSNNNRKSDDRSDSLSRNSIEMKPRRTYEYARFKLESLVEEDQEVSNTDNDLTTIDNAKLVPNGSPTSNTVRSRFKSTNPFA
ncbi:hypothetical protein KAFR_0I01460 [Kazachstania africana CBS 2517]|uniref:ENTH domain-containing protein n=1 Tax=Kazachstania africana (strain ATCC 22294 / BCRC 22015 / CBS 2517 / CECT 1963 / NBRC 1671 / NRRL Y-8276) TaxID=1071382 RepID=H2AZX7_KAZAF|nr:hypothetical protein KAFR_0I01460 [Kazachstania africana CBS 2517]CCF59927.1 hypothetical protein KAFR_0I01460 [Kazachstania africana CBS 2517]